MTTDYKRFKRWFKATHTIALPSEELPLDRMVKVIMCYYQCSEYTARQAFNTNDSIRKYFKLNGYKN